MSREIVNSFNTKNTKGDEGHKEGEFGVNGLSKTNQQVAMSFPPARE
jgi:hypothetical protein